MRSLFFVYVGVHGGLRQVLLRDEADDLHPLGEELAADQVHGQDVLSQCEEDLEDGLADLGQLEAAVV